MTERKPSPPSRIRRQRPTNRATGLIRTHEGFPSLVLGNNRSLAVYLPPGYDHDSKRRYPVFYLHDGQNVFGGEKAAFGVGWEAARTADALLLKGRIVPVLIVGIYNTDDRLNEYTIHHDTARNQGGRGRQYGRFVFDEVKPFVDAHYRTLPDREHTAIAGSSMGGLISLTLAREHHDKFSMCGILSPSLWWCDAQLLAELEHDSAWMRKMKFWIDMGTTEGSQKGSHLHIANLRRLHAAVREAGLRRGQQYSYWEVAGGEHTEASWAARFPGVLEFFFGAKTASPRLAAKKVRSLRSGAPKPRNKKKPG